MIRLLKNTSIKQRLTSLIMSISFISVVLTTLAISVFGVYNLRADILNDLDVWAAIGGDRNTAALIYNDNELANKNLNVFSVKQTIVQACLYKSEKKENKADNIDGQSASSESKDAPIVTTLFSRYVNPPYEQKSQCPTDFTERTLIGDSRIELMKPVISTLPGGGREKIGYIYLESTLEQVDEYIKKQTTIALTVALAALVVSYLLAINLQNAISRPILRLADTARQVSKHKDYSIRATPLGDAEEEDKNELVILTNSFNDMLTEIGARNQQLKQQNVELEKARDTAESANRAKSQFLANISHELRTPLNAIIGFSSILMNQLFGTLGDQKYLEYAKDINESGTHLLDIINDILDLSKAEAGKLMLVYEEVHVGKTVNKCMTILAERAAKGKITITADVPKMLPPLAADRLRFIQILLNILSNAIKFTEEGGQVHIAVRTTETGGEVSHFIITMQDNGIGMSREDIDKAFQSFGQVDSGLNRKYEGTGLGLPLTRKLMELHCGTLGIDSELGKGTLVTMTFPALPPAGTEYKPE